MTKSGLGVVVVPSEKHKYKLREDFFLALESVRVYAWLKLLVTLIEDIIYSHFTPLAREKD